MIDSVPKEGEFLLFVSYRTLGNRIAYAEPMLLLLLLLLPYTRKEPRSLPNTASDNLLSAGRATLHIFYQWRLLYDQLVQMGSGHIDRTHRV
jgi:hypothetical protein